MHTVDCRNCAWLASSATRPGALVLIENHERTHPGHKGRLR